MHTLKISADIVAHDLPGDAPALRTGASPESRDMIKRLHFGGKWRVDPCFRSNRGSPKWIGRALENYSQECASIMRLEFAHVLSFL